MNTEKWARGTRVIRNDEAVEKNNIQRPTGHQRFWV